MDPEDPWLRARVFSPFLECFILEYPRAGSGCPSVAEEIVVRFRSPSDGKVVFQACLLDFLRLRVRRIGASGIIRTYTSIVSLAHRFAARLGWVERTFCPGTVHQRHQGVSGCNVARVLLALIFAHFMMVCVKRPRYLSGITQN